MTLINLKKIITINGLFPLYRYTCSIHNQIHIGHILIKFENILEEHE